MHYCNNIHYFVFTRYFVPITTGGLDNGYFEVLVIYKNHYHRPGYKSLSAADAWNSHTWNSHTVGCCPPGMQPQQKSTSSASGSEGKDGRQNRALLCMPGKWRRTDCKRQGNCRQWRKIIRPCYRGSGTAAGDSARSRRTAPQAPGKGGWKIAPLCAGDCREKMKQDGRLVLERCGCRTHN